MSSGFIETSDPRWLRALQRIQHDVYHRPEYVSLSARYEGAAPMAFFVEEAGSFFLMPLLLRPLPARLAAPAHWCDASSPYGYSSPIAAAPEGAHFLTRCLALFRQAASQRGIVSAFCRLHPLLYLSTEGLTSAGHLKSHGQVVYIDLSAPLEELWSQTRPNHRRTISKLRRAGFRTVMDDWSRFDSFARLYRSTMKRVSAQPFYFFPDSYFTDLRAALGDQLHYCTVLSAAGEVAAAGLFTVQGKIVQYHLGATAENFLASAPSKMMFDCVRSWAKAQGSSVLNLGGGVGGATDSLLHFKAGFSTARAEYMTYRVVVDDDKYAFLNQRSQCRGSEGAVEGGDFFPLYRSCRKRAA